MVLRERDLEPAHRASVEVARPHLVDQRLVKCDVSRLVTPPLDRGNHTGLQAPAESDEERHRERNEQCPAHRRQGSDGDGYRDDLGESHEVPSERVRHEEQHAGREHRQHRGEPDDATADAGSDQRESEHACHEVIAAEGEPTRIAEQPCRDSDWCRRSACDRQRLAHRRPRRRRALGAGPGGEGDGGRGDRQEHRRDRADQWGQEGRHHGDDDPLPVPGVNGDQAERKSQGERRSPHDDVDQHRQREHVVGQRRRGGGQQVDGQATEAVRGDDRSHGDDAERSDGGHQRRGEHAVGRSRVTAVPEVVPRRHSGPLPQQRSQEVGGVVGAAQIGDADHDRRHGDDEARTPHGDLARAPLRPGSDFADRDFCCAGGCRHVSSPLGGRPEGIVERPTSRPHRAMVTSRVRARGGTPAPASRDIATGCPRRNVSAPVAEGNRQTRWQHASMSKNSSALSSAGQR